MTYSYWYIFAAFLLPYVFTILAKAAHPEYTNKRPREFLDTLEGWRKRAHWVQVNSFESFPPFAVSVIIAQQLDANQQYIDILALSFLTLRILYGFFYVVDRSNLRSLAWLLSIVCVIGLFMLAAYA